jgi:hypothetical protein
MSTTHHSLLNYMLNKRQQQQHAQCRRDKVQEFAAKDTAKERYRICIEIAASIPHKTLLSEEF